jgi:hypothetical protein
MNFPLIQGSQHLLPVLALGKMETPKNKVSIWQISDILEEKYKKNNS